VELSTYLLKHGGLPSVDFSELLKDYYREVISTPEPPSLNEFVRQRATETQIDAWRRWHLTNLEPIAGDTLGCDSDIGRRLYIQQDEKKLVATALAESILDGTHCVIPEGSSGLYAGLAMALSNKHINIYTSNIPLSREYQSNRCVAAGFKSFTVMGGEMTMAVAREHGGIFGPRCEEQFKKVIEDHKGRGIILMPVSGLSHDDGPLAWTDPIGSLKQALIESGLASGCQVYFITDYTKHLRKNLVRSSEVAPVYTRGKWKRLCDEHPEQIWVFTAPPPALRRIPAARGKPPSARDPVFFRTLPSGTITSDELTEVEDYNKAAQGLHKLLMGHNGFREVF